MKTGNQMGGLLITQERPARAKWEGPRREASEKDRGYGYGALL